MRWRLAVAGALLLLAAPALAQPSGPQESRGAPAGRFDFWVLALSWSPGFCETTGDSRGSDQCEAGRRLGFVVHGLWPQYENGYPAFCEPSGRQPTRAAVEEAASLFPSEGLARYEWRKHGTCSGLSPTEYFRAVRQARDLVTIPDRLVSPSVGTRVLPGEIERAFQETNKGLRPEMMAIDCGRRVFQEIRICLAKDLRGFRARPQVDRDTCRAGEIRVSPVR